MSALFISFEGIDGCGKSTQCGLLSDYFSQQGRHPLTLREPGATKLGENIRHLVQGDKEMHMDMHTEAYLYAAARCELVNTVIKPALARGQTVICDRFIHSSLAYQGYARGMGVETVKRINAVAVSDTMPQLTFWIDTPVAIAQSRMLSGELDRIEAEGRDFQAKALAGYQALAAFDSTLIHINGNQEAQAVHQQILAHVQAYS